MSTARYTVRAVKFTAVDESGFDFAGSDEPLWIFTARGADGKLAITRSKVFGDVDSGETRRFENDNNRNIVWPAKGKADGGAGPIALSIQLWEIDQGDPNDIAKKTEKAFDVAGAIPVVGDWAGRVPGIVREKLTNLIADDLMGSRTIVFSAARLATQLPRPGSRLLTTHRFGGKGGDLPFEVAGGPDYDLQLEVTRVA